ncbi:MAG: DMT family transporter [Aliishimia sp.]
MSLWIFAALAAASFQTVRFMIQKTLASATLSAAGATFARFLYSAPLVAVLLAVYIVSTGQTLPSLSAQFWIYGAMGGAAQILATVCAVMLFKHRNFAVGTTFTKTEVILTVVVGFILLGDTVSFAGILCILSGLIGVLMLSDVPGGVGSVWQRLWSPTAGLGVASGALFSISAVSYRGASLELVASDPLLRAGVTLSAVTAMQMVAMAVWLRLRDAGEIGRVCAAWRTAGFVGLFSMAGSFFWFTAFTLQNAAYVKAVGQIEVIFSLIASILFFKEKVSRRELAGISLLGGSILALVLLA